MAAEFPAAKEDRSQSLSKDASFPREARLLDAAGYGRVFKKNKRLSNRYWTVLGHRKTPATTTDSDTDPKTDSNKEDDFDGGRLGLAIAKKRAKRAVDRNRIKRIARESFRHHREELLRYDAVVMNKDHAAKASAKELRESLDSLWVELTTKK